jgi:hypothetical protein
MKVFLAYSPVDRVSVLELYGRLRADGFDPWLDEENILPGQDWRYEIKKAVQQSDVVVVCLSRSSISNAGLVHKWTKYALDVSEEKPEGAIFIIPLKLEECDIPDRVRKWQSVNYFEEDGYEKLVRTFRARAGQTPSPIGRVTTAVQGTPPISRSSPPTPARLPDPIKHSLAAGSPTASWIFGSLFTLFILGVFVFSPSTLPEFKQRLLGYICALLAAFFTFFFTGTLAVRISGGTSSWGQIGVKSAGGLGAFVLTLWWWGSVLAPVKPGSNPKDTPTSRVEITVKDARTLSGVSGATVTLGSQDDSQSRTTDDQGSVAFQLAKKTAPGESLALRAEASGYQVATGVVSNGQGNTKQEIFLQPKSALPHSEQRHLSGTWQIIVSGDISNARIRSGTFELAEQPNGSVLVTANYYSDDMNVTCRGIGSLAGTTLFTEFSATNSAGGTWAGKGELRLVSASRLAGKWQSKAEDFFPLELRRLR